LLFLVGAAMKQPDTALRSSVAVDCTPMLCSELVDYLS
jgi:hypothetical protein